VEALPAYDDWKLRAPDDEEEEEPVEEDEDLTRDR
jgi:hypothetical protein